MGKGSETYYLGFSPIVQLPWMLMGSSSFHPVSILPKSFQGKCGKVLEMPSLEKFLEWLLRKHPIFASIVQLHHLYMWNCGQGP
jgi:hypothetical protein